MPLTLHMLKTRQTVLAATNVSFRNNDNPTDVIINSIWSRWGIHIIGILLEPHCCWRLYSIYEDVFIKLSLFVSSLPLFIVQCTSHRMMTGTHNSFIKIYSPWSRKWYSTLQQAPRVSANCQNNTKSVSLSLHPPLWSGLWLWLCL